MTSHAHATAPSHDQSTLPNPHFSSWLRSQTTLFISQIAAILGILLFIAEEIYYISHAREQGRILGPLTVKLLVDYAHILFIVIFILALIRVLHDNERGSYRVRLVYGRIFKHREQGEKRVNLALEESKETLGKFKRLFLWFWIGMLCLYITFACQHTYQAHLDRENQGEDKEVSLTFKGRGVEAEAEKLSVEMSFRIDDERPDAASVKPANTAGKKARQDIHTNLIYSSLAFFFNNFTLLLVFWCFLVMYIKPDEVKKEWMYRAGSGVVVGSLIILYFLFLILKWGEFTVNPVSANIYVSIFDALSGVINAVVLALLIARLDSRMIGLPAWLISILYSYAAVQPLFLVFELGESELLKTITTLVLIFVFISKIYFFLIIFYALQTGKMLNYLTCFPILRRRVDKTEKPAESEHKSKRIRKHQKRDPMPLLLRVSEVIGWLAIIYFFCSLIGPQVIPEAQNWGGGIWSGGLYVVSKVLRPPPLAAFIIEVAQLVFVGLMILALHRRPKNNVSDRAMAGETSQKIFRMPLEHQDLIQDGEAQLQKFKRYFRYFWYITFLLYIIFLIDPEIVYGWHEDKTFGHMLEILLFPALEFLFSSLNLMCAFWCFVALHSFSYARPSPVMRRNSERMRKYFKTRHEHFEARQKMLINYSTFSVLLLIAIYVLLLALLGGPTMSEENLRDYATIFDGVTGLLSAVVLALLIARMDSKLFRVPSRLIWMLFVYASIQSLFIAFAQNNPVLQMVKTSVLTSALGLKLCFFLIVVHTLRSGWMLNYLVNFPVLKERVDSIFENQFEIRLSRTEDEEFTFSILKKNRLRYTATETFKNRQKCDDTVNDLRKLMKKSEPYGNPRPSSGTYWVEVKSGDKILCESIPLRSAEEALDLIDESIRKVPYCKYNRL